VTEELDHRAREAGARLRASVGDVEPRRRAGVAMNRNRLAAGAVAAVVVAVGVILVVTLTNSSSTTVSTAGLLPTGVSVPPGTHPEIFSPPNLGVSVMLPSTWTASPPASGFQYVMTSPAGSGQFLLAANQTGFVPFDDLLTAKARQTFLRSHGANISSTRVGTIDGHPAVRLRYVIRLGNLIADDTEYDVLTTSSLPVGSSQHQNEYGDTVIVLGAPPHADRSVLNWVASTIRVTS
jgi:hypothetical protein